MKAMSSLMAVVILILLVSLGVGIAGLTFLFGIIIPYLAIAVFIIGIVLRVLKWAGAPVPFRVPTTSGQQKSLTWIKSSRFDNPHNLVGVIGRMILEVFFFRSLFKNTKAEVKEGAQVVYSSNKWLWLGGIVFHYSFLIIIIRHFKYFIEPVPSCLMIVQELDGFFQVGVPVLYLTDLAFLAAVLYLFFRRVVIPQIRYISLPADFFPLFLIGSIGVSGVLMRYFTKINIVPVKEAVAGLLSLSPVMPEGIGLLFFIHLFLVCTLIAYFPFSKLVHMAGIFMSPTRNLANNNRMRRHINPWNPEVKKHTYEEWEDEFRDVMKEAGMPLEKE
jgi:nitrate reductase gamma subunit